jgi:hypothetical protein
MLLCFLAASSFPLVGTTNHFTIQPPAMNHGTAVRISEHMTLLCRYFLYY